MTDIVLETRDLRRRHGTGPEVIAGISFVLHANESVALIGPSGCGKTTFLQMVGLLDRPTSGTVLLDGCDAWHAPDDRRAELRLSRIGFVFQQNNLLDHLTARENVALPAWKRDGSRSRAMERAGQLLARFGLSHRQDARAAELSQGEAQRVAIARAVINRPRLILADEPTGSLDSASSRAVMDLLWTVCDDGAALLVITHDATLAARAGRTVVMKDGRLAV